MAGYSPQDVNVAAETIYHTWRIGHWRTAMCALSSLSPEAQPAVSFMIYEKMGTLHGPDDARASFLSHLIRAADDAERKTNGSRVTLPKWCTGGALSSAFPGREREVDGAFGIHHSGLRLVR